jgi:hypothetical protein
MFITIYALINNNHQLKTNLPSNGAIYKKNDFSNLNKKSGFWTFINVQFLKVEYQTGQKK